jgi:D-beta-D-heptose 7-phosphate kinase / D-beta-D-heptose 1-phosphate adenosyltransferase
MKHVFENCKIIVLGDVMLDKYVEGRVDRISPEAPVPIMQKVSQRSTVGGAGNVAANVNSLGGIVHLIAVTGDDEEGRAIHTLLVEHGISCDLTIDAARPSTTKTRLIASGSQLLRLDSEYVGPLAPAIEVQVCRAFERALIGAHVVVVSDYAKGLVTDRVLAHVFATARTGGVPVIVDPKRRNFAAYRGARMIKPNRAELQAATGINCDDDAGAEVAARAVIEQTEADVLLTRSDKGMTLYRRDEAPLRIDTAALSVFDVSGAGDTAVAALALGMAAGMSLPRAIRISNVASGIAVSKPGVIRVGADELAFALMMRRDGKSLDGKENLVGTAQAEVQRDCWRREGFMVGFTNGCFDLLHSGHVSLLRECKAHCDRLIVGLNTDASVRRLKGQARPIQDEVARAAVLGALAPVDLVVMFDEDTPLDLITRLRPDVLIKGADYRDKSVVGADIVKAAGGKVVFTSMVNGQSTTQLIAKAIDRSLTSKS